MRSRLLDGGQGLAGTGITSACAEQTLYPGQATAAVRDHLRVCGADSDLAYQRAMTAGSPPRVRSRRIVRGVMRGENGELGIASACAEQTYARWNARENPRDHLRVCGADRCHRLTCVPSMWITSACAEQTSLSDSVRSDTRDHLRVCGADS